MKQAWRHDHSNKLSRQGGKSTLIKSTRSPKVARHRTCKPRTAQLVATEARPLVKQSPLAMENDSLQSPIWKTLVDSSELLALATIGTAIVITTETIRKLVEYRDKLLDELDSLIK